MNNNVKYKMKRKLYFLQHKVSSHSALFLSWQPLYDRTFRVRNKFVVTKLFIPFQKNNVLPNSVEKWGTCTSKIFTKTNLGTCPSKS